MWPASVVGKLIFGQPPFCHRLAHVLGDTWIVRHEVHQSLLVLLMFFDDLFAAFVVGFGVIVVHADIVSAERTMVVGIRLAVGDRIELVKSFAPAGVENSDIVG